MSILCTSPCFPKCTATATAVLKNMNKNYLGHNCDQHIPKGTAKDYIIEPLEEPIVAKE